MNTSDVTRTITWGDVKAALANARLAFQTLIMDIEAEGLSRLAAGRPDFVQTLDPLYDLKSGLAVVEELEEMLNNVRDARETVDDADIRDIALRLSGIDMARGDINH